MVILQSALVVIKYYNQAATTSQNTVLVHEFFSIRGCCLYMTQVFCDVKRQAATVDCITNAAHTIYLPIQFYNIGIMATGVVNTNQRRLIYQ